MVQDFFHQQYVYISRSMYSKKMYIPPRSPLKGDVIYPMNTHYINLYGDGGRLGYLAIFPMKKNEWLTLVMQ